MSKVISEKEGVELRWEKPPPVKWRSKTLYGYSIDGCLEKPMEFFNHAGQGYDTLSITRIMKRKRDWPCGTGRKVAITIRILD